MSVLKGTLHGANAIVLLVNGQDERINDSMQQMLRQMQVKDKESQGEGQSGAPMGKMKFFSKVKF